MTAADQPLDPAQEAHAEAAAQQAETSFDWQIYRDATLAGLAVLIPIPFVDSFIENIFKKRMLKAIASRRDFKPSADVLALVNDSSKTFNDYLVGCLLLPFKLLFGFILKLSRKIFYFLTVKSAVDALNYYWQRAFLLNHMIVQGHLNNVETARPAVVALEATLEERSQSPLTSLAKKVVYIPSHLTRSLRRKVKDQQDEEINKTRNEIETSWGQFSDYFTSLAKRYEEVHEAQKNAPQQQSA